MTITSIRLRPPAIVMKWRANIEATPTEKEDENNQ
jgi:hypothetical protein